MDANETSDTFSRELINRVTCDPDGADERDPDDDVPRSLLRYLETSRSRASVCEKLILEELGDFPASHPSEDSMTFPFEVDEDTRRPNERVVSDTVDEENNTSPDARLLPEALFTHNVSVRPNNEDDQKRLVSDAEAEEEELKRRIERDFQTQLKKMMETEKLRQKELEVKGRKAQEKLDQELLLQQELMSDLKRRVQEERRMREEEQKRIKEEGEDKRTREEEKIRIEAKRKEIEEEMRRKKEEERRIEERELRKEEERKRELEEKRRVEREERRKRQEEKNKIEAERKEMEEEMRRMKEEEEREKEEEKRTREEEKIKIEAERKEIEEEMKKKKEEERRIEKMELKKKEERKQEQEEKRVESEEKREEEKNKIEMEKRKQEEEMRVMKEEEREKKEEEEKRKREDERKNTEETKKKVEEEKRKMEEDMSQKKEERKKREEENRKIEEEKRITKEIEERKKQEEKRKNKEKEEEEALKKVHAEMKKRDEKEQSLLSELRKKEEEDRKIKEEPRPMEEEEKWEDERKTKEEERRREDLRREDEEGHQEEAEIKLEEDEEGYKRYEDNRKREHEQEEEEKEKEVKKKEVNRKSEEEITLKEKEDCKKEKRGAKEPEEKTETDRTSSGTEPQQHDDLDLKVTPTSTDGVAAAEKRRLAWMEDCVSWSDLSLRNRSKPTRGSARSRRGPRGPAGSGASAGPAPLCPDALLRSTGCKSLQEVTSVTLEDLPGRGSSTLALCTRLRSLTLWRCGLRSLEGVNQLPQLHYIDVQENDISSVDCENMSGLRVLRLGRNKLTSIHGLAGAERLEVLDLSHNSITRIAGLESMRTLQWLSLDHNQLISTRGLGCVYTLLHLSCSHNHLASVEELESSALLGSLDLSANSLAEPPSLSNQVLLRELRLDDNNISSLQGLAACWLPLMQHLSVAQNRITRLPSMSDAVSLVNLDLRFNCVSELQNVCDSLQGCASLRELHLSGNPVQQEKGWRSALQRAAPGLRAVDGRQADSPPPPPPPPSPSPSSPPPPPPGAGGRVDPAAGGFLTVCRAQLQQTLDLLRRHGRELSCASSSLDAVTISLRHHDEVLQLAMDHRFAHEHGGAAVAAGRTAPGDTDADNGERPETEREGQAAAAGVHSSETERKTTSSNRGEAPESSRQHLDLQQTAAVVIQQLWRKYRQKCENVSGLSAAEGGGRGGGGGRGDRGRGDRGGRDRGDQGEARGGGRGGRGDGGKPGSGPSHGNGSVVTPDYAATVIQAVWRRFALRRRLASAEEGGGGGGEGGGGEDGGKEDGGKEEDSGEEENGGEVDGGDAFEFEEVDEDEFVYDENRWTLTCSEDFPPRRRLASAPVKPPDPSSQCILPPPPVWRPKQAWLPGGQVHPAGRTGSPETSDRTVNDARSKSPARPAAHGGFSQRSEKILEEWGFTDSHTAQLMLRRAQKMKPATQKKRSRDPSFRPAFRRCSYPVAEGNRSDASGGEAELRMRRPERPRTRPARPDSDSDSGHFLPEISSDVLSGGRVQLVADPAFARRGVGSAGREHERPRRNSDGPSSGEAPPPRRAGSAPSKRERISHRDNVVQLSGGWGGGKKRDKK